MLEFSSLEFGFSDERVIAEASGALHPGKVIGLIGANGGGKTTLLRLLLGELAAEGGRVQLGRGTEVSFVSQQSQGGDNDRLFQFVRLGRQDLFDLETKIAGLHHQITGADDGETLALLSKAEERFSALGGQRWDSDVKRLLAGLSFLEEDHQGVLGEMSGGQRQKACLARALVGTSNLLIFDEPTNHLDLAAQEFFAGYIRNLTRRCCVLLVSHDRWLLDALCTHTWELDGGVLYRYKGNYSRYAPQRDQRRLLAVQAFERQRAEIARTEEYIRRNIAGQNTKQAQGRRKLLNRMERLDAPENDPEMKFALTPVLTPGEQLLIVENLAFGYGQGQAAEGRIEPNLPPTHVEVSPAGLNLNPALNVVHSASSSGMLIDGLTFTVYRGERLGIVGPNGCGKTTLLKLLCKQFAPSRGMVAWGTNADLGVFNQDSQDLGEGNDCITEIRRVEPSISDSTARSYLARFGFSGDDVFKDVKVLSGGERSRLSLAKIFRQRPNVLLLDEPTNHLDIYAREALEQFLQAYQGSIVMVTHDRALLERICDRLVVFTTLKSNTFQAQYYRGSYSDYHTWLKRREPGTQATTPPRHPSPSLAAADVDPADPATFSPAYIAELAKQARTSTSGYIAKQLGRVTNQSGQVEDQIADAEEQIKACQTKQAEADQANDYSRIGELQNQIDDLHAAIDEQFTELEQFSHLADVWSRHLEQ